MGGMPASALLSATDPDQVLGALRAEKSPEIATIDASIGDAVAGSGRALAIYLTAYVSLARWMADTFASHQHADDDALGPGEPAELLGDLLEGTAAEAPFTPWLLRYRGGDAAALHLTGRLRDLVGGPALPAPPRPQAGLVLELARAGRARDFTELVRRRLAEGDRSALERLMELLDLSKSDLAKLFGVRRQAIDGWLAGGVPAARQEKLAALSALADLLERKLKRARIPGVARRAADAYGGLTMLEMIEADRHGELLASVRAAFDWARAE